MDRVTEHQLRIIRVAILLFGVFGVIFYSYEVGFSLYEMRQPNATHTDAVLKSLPHFPEQETLVVKGKHHQPYEIRSLIATLLIFVVLINLGLLVGVAKQCKVLLKIWLVQAGIWCFVGIYLTILNTFGSYTPLYGSGALSFLGVIAYVFFGVLVWIFHERGEDLETVIRTHRLGSQDDLIPEFNQ